MPALSRLIGALALCPSLSFAATIERLDLEAGAVISITGEFTDGDEKVFIDKVVGLDKALVTFESEGGSLWPALAIGRAIRLKEFATLVPENTTCASACGYAWLGGRRRFMASTANVGFHAAYTIEDGFPVERGGPNAVIGTYLGFLGLGEDAAFYLTNAPPDGMTWVTIENAAEVGIYIEQWIVDPAPTAERPGGDQPSSTTEAPPSAVTPQKLADYIASAITGTLISGSKFEYSVAPQDNTIIKGLGFSADDVAIAIEEAVVESPVELTPEFFRSPRLLLRGFAYSESQETLSIESAELTDVSVLAPTSDRPWYGLPILFSAADISNAQVRHSDFLGEITIARAHAKLRGGSRQDWPIDTIGSVEGVRLPAESFASSKFEPAVLGYDSIGLDFHWDVAPSGQSGMFQLRDITVDVEDAGRLSIKGLAQHVPITGNVDDDDRQNHQIDIHSLRIRFEDSSLTHRVLSYMAAEVELTREEYVRRLVEALPLMFAKLDDKGFQERAAAALGAFFQQPEWVEISIEPTPPISLDEILQLIEASPEDLPHRLQLTVTANSMVNAQPAPLTTKPACYRTLPNGVILKIC